MSLRKSSLCKYLKEVGRQPSGLEDIWSEGTARVKVLSQRPDCIVGGRTKRPAWPKVNEVEGEY